MFPMMCNVDGCEARLIETIHPGVFVCLAPHSETPVFEVRSDDEIIQGTGHVITLRGDIDA